MTLLLYRVEMTCDHDLVIAAPDPAAADRLAVDWAQVHGTTPHRPAEPVLLDEPEIIAVDAVMD